MSLVAVVCDPEVRPALEQMAARLGYKLVEPAPAQPLTRLTGAAPDILLVVDRRGGVESVAEMDRRGIRYWLLHVGQVPASWSQRLPRKPHARVEEFTGAGEEYVARLLDDWKDRPMPRVDCFHFSFREGVPPAADWVLDVRFLDSPHWAAGIAVDDQAAQFGYVTSQPAAEVLLSRFTAMLLPLLPEFAAQRRTVLRIALGCTGGQHRSQAMTDALVARINATGAAVARRLERPPCFLAPGDSRPANSEGAPGQELVA